MFSSTDYSGGSDRYVYSGHRGGSSSRNTRDREADMRETIEPIDPQYHHHHHHHHHHHYRSHREGSVKRGQFTRSLSNNEPPPDEKTGKRKLIFLLLVVFEHSFKFVPKILDGSLSDTAVSHMQGLEVPQKEPVRKESHRDRERERSNNNNNNNNNNQFVGLSKKSNSTSQLSATGK